MQKTLFVLVLVLLLLNSANSQSFWETYEMGRETLYTDIDESIRNFKLAEELALEEKKRTELAQCYWALGYSYQVKGEVVNAKRYYLGSLKIYRILGNIKAETDVLENIGSLLLDAGQYESADRFYKLRVKSAISTNDSEMISDGYSDLGLASINLLEYDSAISFFGSSLSYGKRAYFSMDKQAKILNEIGLTCLMYSLSTHNTALLDSANYYFNQSLDAAETSVTEFHALNNLGNLNRYRKNYDVSQEWLHTAMRLGQSLDSKRLLIPTLNNLGIVNFELGNYDISDSLFNVAVDYNLSGHSVEEIINDQKLELSFDNLKEGIVTIQYLDSLSRILVLSDNKSDMIARLASEHFERKILEIQDMESTIAMELDMLDNELTQVDEQQTVINYLKIITFVALALFVIVMIYFLFKGKAKR